MSLVALCAPLALAGCSALGLGGGSGSGTSGSGSTAGPGGGNSWIVGANGSPTPSPPASRGTGSPPPGLPPVSFLPIDPNADCPHEQVWTVDPVLIPLTVVPAAGSFTVSWPRQYNSNYRIAAIPQPLISGSQPPYTWQDIPAGSGCTITATVSGLKSGTPYVIWLDAPNSGHERDGGRHPYSGRSGVVYPL